MVDTIKLEGELTINEIEATLVYLQQSIAESGSDELVLDLSEVTRFDYSLLQLLAALSKLAKGTALGVNLLGELPSELRQACLDVGFMQSQEVQPNLIKLVGAK